MSVSIFQNNYRPAASLGLAILLSVALMGCATTEQQLQQDGGTCASFGARYGSPAHTQCMLSQQQRRDNQTLKDLEEARLASALARDAQYAIDRRNDRYN